MIGSAILRRCLVGLAMGLTATALIYSPWGKRSGAQMNPSVTLGFLYLGRIATRDAFFYIGAQFLGGALGVGLAAAVLGNRIAHQSVNYAITKPGASGAAIALAAECVISFVLFWAVLNANASPKLMKFTGVIAGTLVFLYISVEAPLSGMSMNPARSFASAVWPRSWTNQWIYFVAPPLAMLAAAELFRRRGHAGRGCAKLVHDPKHSCIFCGQPGRA
jgi:aquaporin Z